MQITQPVRETIENGVAVGVGRANHAFGPLQQGPGRRPVHEFTLQRIIDAVGRHPDDFHHRFLFHFAEQVAIADIARDYTGEPELTASAIDHYFHESVNFFNSFTHP